jgi:hypothetical protein
MLWCLSEHPDSFTFTVTDTTQILQLWKTCQAVWKEMKQNTGSFWVTQYATYINLDVCKKFLLIIDIIN